MIRGNGAGVALGAADCRVATVDASTDGLGRGCGREVDFDLDRVEGREVFDNRRGGAGPVDHGTGVESAVDG